jgi:hypothetical protein
VISLPETLTVPIDPTLIAIIVVLNASSPRAHKLVFLSIFAALNFVIIQFDIGKAIGLQLVLKGFKVVHVVFKALISSDKTAQRLSIERGVDQDVLEDPFG